GRSADADDRKRTRRFFRVGGGSRYRRGVFCASPGHHNPWIVMPSGGLRSCYSPGVYVSGQHIVAIGASSGGIEALIDIVEQLPPDFPAPIFVTIHIPPDAPSIL